MKVRFNEAVKTGIDDVFHAFSEGDEVTVPDADGEKFCARGWAEDVDGKVPTGVRKPGANAALEVASVKNAVK